MERKVRRWRREYLRTELLNGLASLAGAAFAALGLLVWVDRGFALPRDARWTALAAFAAALGLGAHRFLLRPWLSFRWERVLDAAARRFPELKEHLKAAWELRAQAGPHVSEELRRAHLERTERLLSAVPAVPVFPWRPSRGARRSAAAAVLCGATLPWLSGSPSWERVLAPWRDVPLERFVSIVPGDAEVPAGAAVKVAARLRAPAPSGRDERSLELWLDEGDGWKRARWDASAGGAAEYSVEGLTRPLRYRLSLRDLESRTYRLRPVLAPELESLQVRVHGAEPATLALTAAEPLAVLRGTLITVSGRPNQPLAWARMKLSNLPAPVAMKALPGGEYEASLVVQEDAELRFELESAGGRAGASPAYALKAQADMPPKIELLSPLEPLAASPRDSIPLSYEASDDGGLTRISLLVRARGMPAREIVLQRLPGRREYSGASDWELAGLPFGRLEFQLKAVDNASPPQSALSAAGAVDIVDFAAGHADAQRRWDKAEKSLKTLAEQEKSAQALLERGEAAELEKQLPNLPQAWNEAAADFSQWANAMQKDAYANPGLTEAARAQAAALEDALKRGLPEAQKAAKAGNAPAAKDAHERLSARVRQAQSLLSEGRKLQGLQDFYAEAGRLGQTGAELESQLGALSQKGGADPQTMARLKEGLDKLAQQMEQLQKAMQALPKVDASSPEAKARQTYELPLGQARDQADELAKALARGDYAKAAELARKLSESLAQIQRALGDAASDASSAGQARQASERLAKAQEGWSRVVEDQTKVLERTDALEQKRLSGKIAAQKDLLAELARRQAVAVSSAASFGAAFPQDALGMMRSVAAELDSRKVSDSVPWLRGISARLRLERLPAPGWNGIIKEEDDIRDKLEQGPAEAAEAPSAESASVGAEQTQVRGRTRGLERELRGVDEDSGGVPREAFDKLSQAQGEQAAAEQALSKGQSGSAKSHEQAALSLLSSGGQSLSQAMSGAKAIQSGMGRARASGVFRVISGGPGGGGTGAELGFVPLPASQDYAPPREIRDELKKSLEEKRPAAYDGVIKEYFKRISQ